MMGSADRNTISSEDAASLPADLLDRVGAAVETGLDMTMQHKAEAATPAEQGHYRALFQAIPAAIWEIDFSAARALALDWLGSATVPAAQWFAERPERVRELMRSTFACDVNEQAIRLFGPCARENLLVNVERFWPEASTADFAACVVAALAGETYFSCETQQKRFDGSAFDALFTASYASGTVADGHLVVAIMDQSEAKGRQAAALRSEAFYSDMFHGSAFAALHLDATGAWAIYHALYARGITDLKPHMDQHPELIDQVMDGIRVVDVNAQTLALFEVGDRSRIIGSSIARLWFSDHRREPLRESLAGAFAGQPTYQAPARMRTLKGNEISVLFTRTASPALSSAGQVLLAVVDMTEKIRAQNALAEMQANFAHADRVSSLGELTASIAHEVNQPLAAITANGEAALRWLDREAPDLQKVGGLVNDMIADALRASDIVTHVRSMAAPQAGQRRRVSLDGIVDEALILLDPQLARCGTPAVRGEARTLPDIWGDPIQLQQVVFNLVLNALQAMAATPGSHLILRTQEVAAFVILTVEDNGPGIPEDRIGKLFGSFYTTKKDGMGIGLAICRTIVEAHGGTIAAESLASGGARFTVRLPAL